MPSNQCELDQDLLPKRYRDRCISFTDISVADVHTGAVLSNTCICCTWLPDLASQAPLCGCWAKHSVTSLHKLLFCSISFSSKLVVLACSRLSYLLIQLALFPSFSLPISVSHFLSTCHTLSGIKEQKPNCLKG